VALVGTLPEELFGCQRSSERLPCSLVATLCMGGLPYEVECVDISTQGIGIISPLRLVLHACVKIDIALNDKEVSLKGRVNWCSRHFGSWKAGIELYTPIPYILEKIVQ
jgi:hypothetical protein